jgi:hypothetical protein
VVGEGGMLVVPVFIELSLEDQVILNSFCVMLKVLLCVSVNKLLNYMQCVIFEERFVNLLGRMLLRE